MHLVLISTSGNQSYIFASNRLREAVGASYLVARSTTAWVASAAALAGGTVLQASSGSTLVTVPDEDAARALAHEVTLTALRNAPGLAVRAASIAIACDAPTGDEVRAAFSEHRSFSARCPSIATRHQRLPMVAACDSTDGPAQSWHADTLRGVDGLEPEEPRLLSAEVIAKRAARPAAAQKLADLLAGDQRLTSRRLVKIDKFFDQVEWVGVVHADGNQLGAFFREAADVLGGRMVEDRSVLGMLSEQVQAVADAAFLDATAALASRVRAGRLPLVPLIIGGDDLTALVDGRHVLAFVREYLVAFARHSVLPEHGLIAEVMKEVGQQQLTASTGVAIVKPHFPFSVAYRLADELCSNAKGLLHRHPGHHGIDVHVLIDSTVTDLRAIRSRYEEGTTAVLTERPFLIGAGSASLPPERDWDVLLERLEQIADTPSGGDGVLVTRTQLHALRDELRRDPGRARRRLKDLGDRVPTTGADRDRLNALRSGGDGLARGLLDLLELAPFVRAEETL